MRLITTGLSVAAFVLLAACSTLKAPISNDTNPVSAVTSLLPTSVKDQVATDMTDTAYNFDQGQAIGIIDPSSTLPACVHSINQQLGIEPNPNAPPVQSFTPKLGGLPASAGSVLYLDALKLAKMKATGISISQDCVTAWGMLNLQGLSSLFTIAGGLPIHILPLPTPSPAPAPAPVKNANHH